MTISNPTSSRSSPLAALRSFARKRPQGEKCDLCGALIAHEHQHLMEPANRRLVCTCDACSILFSGQQHQRYRRVPRRIEILDDFRMTDLQWESLHLPIFLAFFYRHSPTNRIVAMYPSPAGATESLLDLESWKDLAAENPVLNELEADVEALLVNRVGQNREYCRVPIDECFKLVGLIRSHWRGLSGGTEVWREINQFFASLKQRSSPTGGSRA
jgi:hypothetical protein